MNTGESIDKEFWSVDENDDVFYTAGVEPIRTSYKDFPAWKLTNNNDLLLARNGTPYVYLPSASACYTDHIIRANVKSNINRKFVRYSLQQSISSVVVDSVSLATWSASLWNEQAIAWPSSEVQSRIVAFLDYECAKIDEIINKTRTSIEEYKKLKQAVIIQTVTKGIRNNRAMKKSGIEWITEIPNDWQECRIKNAVYPQEKPVLPSDEIITCFRDGEVTLRRKRREEGFTVSFTENGYHGVDVGDLVIHGMDAFAGAIGCSDSRGKTTPVVHVCNTIGNNRYFMYYLRSLAYGNILMDLSSGVRIRSSDYRNFSKLGVFGVLVPPKDEQDEIVTYLDSTIANIDRLLTEKAQLLSELEAFKKSVIFEYITGKKEAPLRES